MTVRDEVLGMIGDVCALPEPGLSEDSAFKDISIDSLSFIELIVAIEDRYGIGFDGDELNIYGYGTVGDFVDTVERRIEIGTAE